jgi:hypothetical protein
MTSFWAAALRPMKNEHDVKPLSALSFIAPWN